MTITKEQLTELTERINERLLEFGPQMFNELTQGVVRLVHDEIEAWWEADDRPAARLKPVDPAVGDPMMDGFHTGYTLGFERGKDAAKPATFDAGTVPEHAREILGRWIQLMAALVADMRAAGDTDGSARLITEALTIRAIFDLYNYGTIQDDDDADVDPGPDFDGGFYMRTPEGNTVHVNGDPNMAEETAAALGEMMDAVVKQHIPKDDRILTPQERLAEAREKRPFVLTEEIKAEREAKARAFWGDEEIDRAIAAGEYPKHDPSPDSSQKSVKNDGDVLPPSVAATLGPEHTIVTPLKPAATHPWKNRVDGKPSSPIGRDRLTDPDVARDKLATAITSSEADGLRARLAQKPRSLAEVDADRECQEAIDALRAMAVGGNMPTMLRWDNEKPSHFPQAQHLLKKLGLSSWIALADLVGLRTGGRGRQGEREEEDESIGADDEPDAALEPGEEVRSLRMTADEKAAQLREILYALQDMAVDGTMPSINDWNLNRPAHLPIWQTILNRWPAVRSWGEMAGRAKLQYDGKRKKSA